MAPDELTGLLSRAEILDRLQGELALASQQNRNLVVLQADCDHLLRINNEYGHVAGDRFIERVAGALAEFTAGLGAAGRIGGDEFLAVLPGQPLDEAMGVAERIRAAVEARPLVLTHQGQALQLPVTVTIGLSFFPDEDRSITSDELVRRAYDALLRAKQDGGNAVCLYAQIEERDPLTGVLKRGGILAQFEKARAQADQTRAGLALINLDIDEFDSINKQYGHYTGDEVLRRVARSLVSNFKSIGHVGRYAGDEFVVLLPDTSTGPALDALLARLRAAIDIVLPGVGTPLKLRISLGVASRSEDTPTLDALMRQADAAMYRAKESGQQTGASSFT